MFFHQGPDSWHELQPWYEPVFMLLLILLFTSCDPSKDQAYFSEERMVQADHFKGSETCRECHEEEYEAWMGSHHQLAMMTATPENVLGDFNESSFEHKGIRYRFFKNGEDFMVNTIGADGEYHDFAIKYTFGVIPLQQYIVEFEKGNHQCLLVAWDSDSLRWFHLQPDLDIHHEEWMHWTGGSMTWNNMCADCHSTFVRKNYNRIEKTYDTKYTEINVGCESCHGPGERHNEYFLQEEKYSHLAPPEMYMPAKMTSTEIVQKCARCHSRRSMFTEVFDYKGHFLDHYYPNLLHYPTYEKDGQILDEDYVYGSFMQSRMYHEKISCRDCHDMHSMEVRFEGNTLCLLCHEPKYNSYEHHYHEEGTEGAACINCHMTGRYYMGNDFRNDHSFRIPRPDQSVQYGTPNACYPCHTDQTDQWAVDFIREKYGPVRPDHFSDRLLAGLEGNTDSLISLLGQTRFPEIARATAVQPYARQIDEPEELDLLESLLKDSSALVRREAVNMLDELSVPVEEEIKPLLSDTVRAVRIAAARYFVMRSHKADLPGFEKARKEYMTELEVNSDFASGNHQWALYYSAHGDRDAAMMAYREALRIDNYYNASRMNLALMEYENGNTHEAERLYLQVIEQEPEYSYPWFMLGLLYNETGESGKSLSYLSGACDREPFLVRAHYNYALKLQELKKYSEADVILDKALAEVPANASLLYVKLLGTMEMGNNQQAIKLAERLVALDPQNQRYKQILTDLKNKFK